MVSSQTTSAIPILLSAYAPVATASQQWPLDLLALSRLGSTAIVATLPWEYDPALVADFSRLCQQFSMQVLWDIDGISAPPVSLIQQHPVALQRDSHGQPYVSSAGQLQVIPLHPALQEPMRLWLGSLAKLLQVAELQSTILGLYTSLPTTLVHELQQWQQQDGWQLHLYHSIPQLQVDTGWPFQQPLVWNTPVAHMLSAGRGLAMLALGAGQQLAQAVPPPETADIRAAWADSISVQISLRHAGAATYLAIKHRGNDPYSGVLTYRNAVGELLHVHANLGPNRSGVILLQDEEIVGAAFTADASEGVWLLRAMQSSVVFNGGSGAAVPCGTGFVLLADASGRFQIRRPSLWNQVVVYRMLRSGELVAASCQIEASHLSVPYVAQDALGSTDWYLVTPANTALEEPIRRLLVQRLVAQAEYYQRTGYPALQALAERLIAQLAQLQNPDQYRLIWEEQSRNASARIEQILLEYSSVRAARLLRGQATAEPHEEQLARILEFASQFKAAI
jgi:hypothetical protein